MAVYTGNDDWLTIDGEDMSDFLFQVRLIHLGESRDNTKGTTKYRSRMMGLRDVMLDFSIAWDVDQETVILPLVDVGIHLIDYGPRGNASGRPRHTQEFIFEEVPFDADMLAKGEKRTFSIRAKAANPPIHNIYRHGVFA